MTARRSLYDTSPDPFEADSDEDSRDEGVAAAADLHRATDSGSAADVLPAAPRRRTRRDPSHARKAPPEAQAALGSGTPKAAEKAKKGRWLNLSPDEPLPLHRRKDLVVECHTVGSGTEWVVKDPMAQAYFRFEEPELAALSSLDGRLSQKQLLKRLRKDFPERNFTSEELQWFLTQAVQQNLVLLDRPGEGERLSASNRSRRARESVAPLFNPLWIKIPLWDPDRLLENILPWTRWCFSWAALASAGLLALSALLLTVVHAEELAARLPQGKDFFTPDHLGWMLCAWLLSKSLHELGHGLLCKYYGGEVHEMGVILIGFLPCMYCNVSDSWMTTRGKRAAIGAAGMGVELVLASVAAWGWWFSNPGIVHSLCLQTIVVCSAGTLFFNANPLMRYDGYYILSDLLEIPNLRAKAQRSLTSLLAWLCLGWNLPVDGVAVRSRAAFAAYAAASFVYRWSLMYAMLFLLEKWGEPYHLESVGRGLSLLLVAAAVLAPLVLGARMLLFSPERQPVNLLRLFATASLVGGLGWIAATVRFPQEVEATFMLEPSAVRLYVSTPGVLEEAFVRPGQVVPAGAVAARLANTALETELLRLAAQQRTQAQKVERMERERHRNAEVSMQLPAARQALADLGRQLDERRRDAEKLVLRTPVGGTVLPPPAQRARGEKEELRSWDDTPLADRNVGCYLESGTLFCQIGDSARFEAVLAVDQSDVEQLHAGQSVRLMLDGMPETVFTAKVDSIAGQEMDSAPEQLSKRTGGRLATRVGADGRDKPLEAHYQVKASLAGESHELKPGLRGRARILVGERTWVEWFVRSFHQTFHFRW